MTPMLVRMTAARSPLRSGLRSGAATARQRLPVTDRMRTPVDFSMGEDAVKPARRTHHWVRASLHFLHNVLTEQAARP